MRIREVHFDDVVSIPGHTQIAGGTTTTRETTFHADDGWEIRETLPGVFSLLHSSMTEPVTVGGYGYSFVPISPLDEPAPAKKGKR